jgi:hypothetical protein
MRPSSQSERGFALLFVFALAACVAILLYMELPQAAFEAQRLKEDLLVERGQQYVRAIRLYARRNNRFPSAMSDLENTNNVRYLRRRYKDPLTGKDDWRLLHAGPGGVITDSLISKSSNPAKDKDKNKNTNTFITEGPAIGATLNSDQAIVYTARRRRGRQVPSTDSSGQDTHTSTDSTTSQTDSSSSTASTSTPSAGAPGSASSNSALDMIRRLLTTPRAGGLQGLNSSGTQIGGGIVGVASKVDAQGIKIVNDQTNYKLWEFVYDLSKDPLRSGNSGTGAFTSSSSASSSTNLSGATGSNIGGMLTSPQSR